MRKTIFIFVILICYCATAQNTISGTFSPAKEYSWLIAYRLKPGTQAYAADTSIKDGYFSLKLPENSPKGIYRLVYAIPQEEFYFDVVYDGIEDINLSFDSQYGVHFTMSKENILFTTYFSKITAIEKEIIAFYSSGSSDFEGYQKIIQNYNQVQESYERKSEGLVANQFIKANKPHVPSSYESIQDFVRNRKRTYFNNLDLENTVLQASGFLTDKLGNYVFTALPLEKLNKTDTEREIQKNITTVYENLNNVSDVYSFHVLYTLWKQSSASGLNETADFIFTNYLKNSSAAQNNQEIIDNIEIDNRLRIGAVAPEIVWKNGADEKKLSTLDDAKNYVLVFWSSTCGHCLKELPALHKKLEGNKAIKVIAVGLENDDALWKIETSKLENFDHAISLGKWDSEYASLYDIQATPTYFVLNKNKQIIAKPDSDKDVVSFIIEK